MTWHNRRASLTLVQSPICRTRPNHQALTKGEPDRPPQSALVRCSPCCSDRYWQGGAARCRSALLARPRSLHLHRSQIHCHSQTQTQTQSASAAPLRLHLVAFLLLGDRLLPRVVRRHRRARSVLRAQVVQKGVRGGRRAALPDLDRPEPARHALLCQPGLRTHAALGQQSLDVAASGLLLPLGQRRLQLHLALRVVGVWAVAGRHPQGRGVVTERGASAAPGVARHAAWVAHAGGAARLAHGVV
mmetsp:Transcript_20181/g.64375  ORF Transcript_20181/g.64375 Transcript_20181/m.64375 type:complete len:245 (+) Transcript_20181:46-780(+)